MSNNYAKTTIIGNLGAEPEVRYSADGEARITLSVGVTESWLDAATKERRERTEWYRVVKFRASEKFVAYVNDMWAKGALVFVEGRMQTRKWQDQQGQDRYSTELMADDLKLLSRPKRDESGADGVPRNAGAKAPRQASGGNAAAAAAAEDPFGEDMPF